MSYQSEFYALEKALILKYYSAHGENAVKASKAMGMSRNTLNQRLRLYGIKTRDRGRPKAKAKKIEGFDHESMRLWGRVQKQIDRKSEGL